MNRQERFSHLPNVESSPSTYFIEMQGNCSEREGIFNPHDMGVPAQG
jgi:hypothetical protein